MSSNMDERGTLPGKPPLAGASRTNTTHERPGPSLMSLPAEIRRRILDFSPVVVRPTAGADWDSLEIDSGRVDARIKTSSFSTALFYTCRVLSLEARQVCWARNRFQFSGLTLKNMDLMLVRQPKHLLELVREIEYKFYEADLFDFCEEDGYWKETWSKFPAFLRTHLKVSNIVLSIDASAVFMNWITNNEEREDLEEFGVPEAYQRITEPLKQLSDCKALFLYWPAFHNLESEEEARVMGEHYNAYDYGKTIVKDRAPGWPRGSNYRKDLVGMLGYYDDIQE